MTTQDSDGRDTPPVSPPAATKPSKTSDLLPRAASAVVMVAAALTAVWIGGPLFDAFWLAAGAAVLWEWQTICLGERRFRPMAAGAAALAAAAGAASNLALEWSVAATVLGAVVAAALAPAGRRLWAASGVIYACALTVAVIFLRGSLFFGREAIIWLFAVVWTTDIMAYFGGRLVGGPKLWPRVSPSKTWSGFITGVSCGALAGLAVSPSGVATIPWVAGLSLVTAMISQGGDLLESSIKRRFGVKDSGALIPGHGGVMDRLDGFIAAAVFAALVAFVRGGFATPAISLFKW
jgi:phosphatidate cytidylyltransferase